MGLVGGTSRGGASGRDQDECKWGSTSSPLVVLPSRCVMLWTVCSSLRMLTC